MLSNVFVGFQPRTFNFSAFETLCRLTPTRYSTETSGFKRGLIAWQSR